MAEIKGKNNLKAVELYEIYSLETDEPVKGGITWTISTESNSYKVAKPDYERSISIDFKNTNEYDIPLIIKAEYYLTDGKKRVVTKDVVLLGTNVNKTGQADNNETKQNTADTGNKSATVQTADTGKQTDEEKSVVLKIHVYFDGTAGNRYNIDLMNSGNGSRHEVSPGVTKTREEILKESEIDPNDKNNSYNQVYTNIPNMYDMELIKDKSKTITVYIEGVGSRKYGKDDTLIGSGFGLDKNETGIPSKIQRAMQEIIKELNGLELPQNSKIGKAQVTVFGFSRGAATARSFVSYTNQLAGVLGIDAADITYKFVGIFDTVCSVTDFGGWANENLESNYRNFEEFFKEEIWDKSMKEMQEAVLLKAVGLTRENLNKWVESVKNAIEKFRNKEKVFSRMDIEKEVNRLWIELIENVQSRNVKEFNLNMGAKVEKVVHLTAADEYRVFFPLTDISSSIQQSFGYELELPGTHCNIGGGNKTVKEELYEEEHPKLIDRLVKEGWHTSKKAISYRKKRNLLPPFNEETELLMGVSRQVNAGFEKIPMEVMLRLAQDHSTVEPDEEKKIEILKIPSQGLLADAKAVILSYALNNFGNHKRSVINELKREGLLKDLRHKYIHHSAYPENGLQNNIKELQIPFLKDMANRLSEEEEAKRKVFKG